MSDQLIIKKNTHIAELIFNRPKVYNALDEAMLEEFGEALKSVSADADIRVILVKSALEKSFLSGADIAYMEKNTPEGTKRFIDIGCEVFDAIAACPQPVIAAINGYCLGGGLEFALACDIRIASSRAKLGFPEVKLGIFPGWGGLSRTPREVGLAKAMELIFTGKMITADEAKEMGLVNRVVEPDALEATAQEMATMIAANAPLAVQTAKKWLPHAQYHTDEVNKAVFAHAMLDCFQTDDQSEGMRAFLEKRPPTFKGR